MVALSEPQNVEQGISNDELGVPDVGAVNMQRSAVQVLDNLFNLVGVLRTCFKLEYPHPNPLPHAGEGTR